MYLNCASSIVAHRVDVRKRVLKMGSLTVDVSESKLAEETIRPVGSRGIFAVSYRSFMWMIIACPLVSFTLCVVLSLLYNFDESTATQCLTRRVYNVLPSASAAIGNHTPQRYIWRYGVGLHIAPRMLVAYTYLHFLLKSSPYAAQTFYKRLIQLNYAVNNIELLSLMGIACISSTENYPLHRSMFLFFGVSSLFHMTMQVLFFKDLSRFPTFRYLQKSYKTKQRLLVIYLVALMLAVYFFHRHNAYCENYVYSLFALAEYVVIFTNIVFHGSAIMDFGDQSLTTVVAISNKHGYSFVPNESHADTFAT